MNKDVYTLFGAEVSLFSGKTRAYLNYKNIPYKETLSSAKVVNGELYKNTGMRMIPVVKTPKGEYIQDTTAIMDELEKGFPEPSVLPEAPIYRLIAMYLELYGDEWLLLPAMHYRWHYKRDNLWFILKDFGASAMPHWPTFLQPIGALVPALYFGRLYKPVLGISKQNWPEVEAFYQDFLANFNEHLGQHNFVLGNRPSIADFGFYGPLYAHLYRDPYAGKLMKEKAPEVAKWVERVRSRQRDYGHFLELDMSDKQTLPPFIVKTLKHMVCTQLPVLEETVRRVHKRCQKNPGEKLPRFLGKTNFCLGKVTEQRYVNAYAQWMLQRPLNYFFSLDEKTQISIQEIFAQHDIEALLNLEILSQVTRKNNKLYPMASL